MLLIFFNSIKKKSSTTVAFASTYVNGKLYTVVNPSQINLLHIAQLTFMVAIAFLTRYAKTKVGESYICFDVF
jgi:hypothetical protein